VLGWARTALGLSDLSETSLRPAFANVAIKPRLITVLQDIETIANIPPIVV
jgi:hypothetical protein